MKKFKKIIAMCLTAAMALSMMSVGAFAADNSINVSSFSLAKATGFTMNNAEDPYDAFPEIGSTVTLEDENGNEYTAIVGGYVEAVKDDSIANRRWASSLFNDVEIPRNIDGNQGVQVGLTYTAGINDQYACFSTSDWNAYLHRLNFSVTEQVGSTNYVYYGYVESEGNYICPQLECVNGRRYSYRFSSEQSTNSQATCDLQLFSGYTE